MPRNSSGNWWSPASTLAERAVTRRADQRVALAPNTNDDTHGELTDESAPASPRLHRWRRQRPFDRPEFFERRLRADALTESEFASLVASGCEPNGDDDPPPAWVAFVDRARAIGSAAAPVNDPTAVDLIGTGVARAFVEPFVVAGMSSLFMRARQIHEANPSAPFHPEGATRLFEPALWSQLVTRALKVVILELNVARVQGVLVGDTPQARYAHFARLLRTTTLRQRLLEEYPVLARLLVTACRHWETFAAEFLERLARDHARLAAELGNGAALGVLSELSAGAGDTHRDGRSVIVAAFSSGLRVVYKPRALGVDVCFEQLIAWVNERGQTPPLRAVRTIDCATHGWAEFIAPAPCATSDEVTRFYERFGAYVALLHVLEATDFHYENVIASGEHPMLIDLEALCHPRLATPPQLDDPEWIGWSALQHSVLRAGVLPFRAYGNDESSGLDMSAVGGGEMQLTPNRLPVLVNAGTDEMRLVREFVMIPPSFNRPALGSEAIDPTRHADRILAGFTATYRLLAHHRGELLASDSPVRRFADADIRVVMRPTRQYALILMESYHPDVLRNALDRDCLLDRLWVAVPSRPEIEPVIGLEHADLVVGDVPIFTSRAGSRDLIATHGQRIVDYFEQSGLDAAIARVESLGDDDLLRQQWVVRASLAGLTPGRHTRAASVPEPRRQPMPNVAEQLPSRDASIAAAERVANRIDALALRQGDRISWLGLTLARERDWTIQPIGADLYSGTLGVAFFLAYLADATGTAAHARLARQALAHVVPRIRRLVAPENHDAEITPGSLGAFGSLGGAIYVLAHLGVLWNDHDLLDVASAVATRVRGEVAADRHLDVMAGVGGLIFALDALHRARDGGPAHDVMRISANRLLDTMRTLGPGVAWDSLLASTQPLTGFSHGASGIGAALFTAASVLNDSRYAAAARGAFAYERGAFDTTRQNWPDYRILDTAPPSGPPPTMCTWCHGAPGIGVARLIAMQHGGAADTASELDTSIAATIQGGFGFNDSLCHGDLGNLDLLIRARELGIDGEWRPHLAIESRRLVDRIGRGEWRCGIPGGVETPGLMMGLAGIGYGLLRLGATERAPSLLSLEPPRRGILAPSAR